ncbi:barstar family protein [Myxococcaceae bacterium GXIMD 01537]
MTEQPPKFRFVADPMLLRTEVSHVGRIPAGVSGKEQLMSVLEETLRLPGYFGRNWDALPDCLRDLSWLPPGRISLVHEALPNLPLEDLRAYVNVLAAAVGDWKPLESYELVVVFPEQECHRVLELLES